MDSAEETSHSESSSGDILNTTEAPLSPDRSKMAAPAVTCPRPAQAADNRYQSPKLIPTDIQFVAVSLNRQLSAGVGIRNQGTSIIYNSPSTYSADSDAIQNNMDATVMKTPVLIVPKRAMVKPHVRRNSPNIPILPKPTIQDDNEINGSRSLDSPSRAARLEAALNLLKQYEEDDVNIGVTDKANDCSTVVVHHTTVSKSSKRAKNNTKKKQTRKCGGVMKTSVGTIENADSDLPDSHVDTTGSALNTDIIGTEEEKHKPKRKKIQNTNAQAQYFGALHRTMSKRVKLTKDCDERDIERKQLADETLLSNPGKCESLTADISSESVMKPENKQIYQVKKPKTCTQGGTVMMDTIKNGRQSEHVNSTTNHNTSGLSSNDILANHTLLKRIVNHNAYTVSLIPHVQQHCTTISHIKTSDIATLNSTTLTETAGKTVALAKYSQTCPRKLSYLANDVIEIKANNKYSTDSSAAISTEGALGQSVKTEACNDMTVETEAKLPNGMETENISHKPQYKILSSTLHTNNVKTTATTSANQMLVVKRLLSGNTNSPNCNNQQKTSHVHPEDKVHASNGCDVDADVKTADIQKNDTVAFGRKRKMKSPQKYNKSTRQTYYVIDKNITNITAKTAYGVESITSLKSTDSIRNTPTTMTGTNTKSKLQELLSYSPKPGCSTDKTENHQLVSSNALKAHVISGNHGLKSEPVPLNIRNCSQLARPMPITPAIYNYLMQKSTALVKPVFQMNNGNNEASTKGFSPQNTSAFIVTKGNVVTATNYGRNKKIAVNCNTIDIARKEMVNPTYKLGAVEKRTDGTNSCKVTEHYSNNLTVAQLLSAKRAIDGTLKQTHENNPVSPEDDIIANNPDMNQNTKLPQISYVPKAVNEKIKDNTSNTIESNMHHHNHINATSSSCSQNPVDHSYTKSKQFSPSTDSNNLCPLIKQYKSKYTQPISPLVHSTSQPHCARSKLILEDMLNSNVIDRSSSEPCLKTQLQTQGNTDIHSMEHEILPVSQHKNIDKQIETAKGQSPFALRVGNKMYVVRPISNGTAAVSVEANNTYSLSKPKTPTHNRKAKRTPDRNKTSKKGSMTHLNRKVRKLIKNSKEPFDKMIHSLRLMPTKKLKTRIRRASSSPHKITFSPESSKHPPAVAETPQTVASTTGTDFHTKDNDIVEETGAADTLINTMQIYKYDTTECTYCMERVKINIIAGKNAKYHRWFRFSDYPCTLHFNSSNIITQIDIESIKTGFYLIAELDKKTAALNIQGNETVLAVLSAYPPHITTLPDESMAIVIGSIDNNSETYQPDEVQSGNELYIDKVLMRVLETNAFKDVISISDGRYMSIVDPNMSPKAQSVKFYTEELFDCFSPGYTTESQTAPVSQPSPGAAPSAMKINEITDKSNNSSGGDCVHLPKPKVKLQEKCAAGDKRPPMYNNVMVLKMKRKQSALFKKCQQLKHNKALSAILASLSQQSRLSDNTVASNAMNVSSTVCKLLDDCTQILKRGRKKGETNLLKNRSGTDQTNVATADMPVYSHITRRTRTNICPPSTPHEVVCAIACGKQRPVDVNDSRRITRSQNKC